MTTLKKSTRANVLAFMSDSTDHTTGETGLTLDIYLSKDNTNFTSASPVVTEKGYGWYQLALTADHTDTEGTLAIHIISGSGVDPSNTEYRVESDYPTPSEIWGYGSRTLTYSPNNLISITSDELSFTRGDTISYDFEEIEHLDEFEEAYFTVKSQYKDLDTEAILQVSSASGLLYLNGVSASASGSTASITSASATQALSLYVDYEIAKQLPYKKDGYYYDLQFKTTSGSVITPYLGVFNTVRDVTKTQ